MRWDAGFTLLVALAPGLGCTGKIGAAVWGHAGTSTGGTAGSTGAGTGTGGPVDCESASARRVRRLSQREYFNVVTDLLGPDLALLGQGMLPLEPTVAGFDNQDTAL